MIFRNLDENSDWTFGKGINCYLRDNSAIGLNIRTRILSWLNDCFFDPQAGIDWVNRLGSKNQRVLLELDLRRIILQSEGVTGILEFDSTLTDRNFTANYSVQTIFSQSFQDSIEVGI
jgi:hypothetical protein